MKIEEIKQWRQCELLKPFFEIRCASTVLDECSLGKVIDFLIEQAEKQK